MTVQHRPSDDELALALDVVLERLSNLALLDQEAAQRSGGFFCHPHALPVATG